MKILIAASAAVLLWYVIQFIGRCVGFNKLPPG